MPIFKRSEYLLKIFGNAFLVIFFAMLQISFFARLPWPFNYFNLILPVILFLTIILNYKLGLWFAFFIGLILDLFSSLNFGALTLSLLFTVAAVNALFNNFFTNRSFYSLIILGFLGNLIYIALLLIFNLIFFIFGAANNLSKLWAASVFFGLLWQLFFSVLLLAVLFFAFNFLSKKLKSVFY